MSLSLNNNLIPCVHEFKVVNKQLDFLNMQFNPFIGTDYGYYEYFITTFKSLRRLNGQAVEINLIRSSEVISRWFIHFLHLIDEQYALATRIVR